MRARVTALAFVLLSSTVLACSSAPLLDEDETASTSQALRRLDDDGFPEPVEPPGTPPSQPCRSLRFDIYRSSGEVCQMPPPAAGGTWTKEPLFPQAPAAVRDRFCAYTWTPTGTTPSCAPAPWRTIPSSSGEQIAGRGHCPLDQPGCGPTVISKKGGFAIDRANDLVLAITQATAVSRATKSVAATSPTTPRSSSGLGKFVAPATNVGCCDACAEVAGDYAFVVLTDNQSYKSVYFDVGYAGANGPSLQRVTVNNPATNIIQVGLDPYRQYAQGMIWATHTTE